MPDHTLYTLLMTVVEAVATLAFALSGLLEAARKRLDAVGVCVVAVAIALARQDETARALDVLRHVPLDAPALTYSLPEFRVVMPFRPTEFTQVNPQINQVLVSRALRLLDPQPGERIADLFCGLGNFSLPIAQLGATVVGVEGSDVLVRRAGENAAANGLGARCEFHAANLFEATEDSLAALGRLDKLLIDPPREGAIAVVKALGPDGPGRIVYVSCNPATLARDAAVLVHEKGYRLKGAGIANMFPQTSHVESIALFERA